MQIESFKEFEYSEFEDRIRRVTMLKDTTIMPYLKSTISIINVDPNCLSPCQFYILKSELDLKIDLQHAFNDACIDIFNINSFIEFKAIGENSSRILLPPIVEESIENDGIIYNLINDGMHRIFLSRLQRKRLNIVYIRDVPVKYYAYPLLNGWKDVKIVDKIDKNLVKKIHRIKDNKMLYRNFDSVFMNCSKPRGINFTS